MSNPPTITTATTTTDVAPAPIKPSAAVRPLLVNVAQAAQTLCLSRSSIYQLIWTDQLVPIRIGRSVRFSVEQLERFVADRSRDEDDPSPDEAA
jgi:excisionase family DNA binding protein